MPILILLPLSLTLHPELRPHLNLCQAYVASLEHPYQQTGAEDDDDLDDETIVPNNWTARPLTTKEARGESALWTKGKGKKKG